MNWQDVVKLLRDIFAYSDIQIVIYSLDELAIHAMSAEGDPELYAEDEIDRYSEEFHLNERELETDFTSEAKSCQPDCDEQFPILSRKEENEALFEHYLQYQPKDLIDYVKQFDFQYSDITDNEMTLRIDMLIDSKDVYSLHKFDVGKTRQKFHVTLKPNVELKRQRASKVPLHLKDKLEKLLTQLKDADIIREMGDDDEMGSLFVNPIILMPKNDYVKLVIDARYLNSVTDLTNYSRPLEPVQMIMTRVNGKFFSVSDLSCAYHQVPLSSETKKLTSFIINGRQYTFTRGFYGLCGLPNFFSCLMTIQFDPLIKKKQVIIYIDDTIMQSQTTGEMFTIIKEYHTLLGKAGLKAAPDKTFFFFKKVEFMGHVISPDGIQPTAKGVDTLRNIKSPQSKRDVMKVVGCLGFYNCYIKNLHVDSQPFYDLIKDSTPFHRSTGPKNMRNCLAPLKKELTKIQFYNFLLPNNLFIFMWTHQMLVQVVFLSNSSPRERELSRLTLVYLTKQNKNRPLFTKNCVESYPLSRHTNTALLDHHFPSISIVIINQFFTYGDAKDN